MDTHAILANVVLDLVADVGHVVEAVVVVAPCRAATAVLDVRVVGLDSHLEAVLGPRVVGLGGGGLLFPFHHLDLVKMLELHICSKLNWSLSSSKMVTSDCTREVWWSSRCFLNVVRCLWLSHFEK
jgi:hypothetical protein